MLMSELLNQHVVEWIPNNSTHNTEDKNWSTDNTVSSFFFDCCIITQFQIIALILMPTECKCWTVSMRIETDRDQPSGSNGLVFSLRQSTMTCSWFCFFVLPRKVGIVTAWAKIWTECLYSAIPKSSLRKPTLDFRFEYVKRMTLVMKWKCRRKCLLLNM